MKQTAKTYLQVAVVSIIFTILASCRQNNDTKTSYPSQSRDNVQLLAHGDSAMELGDQQEALADYIVLCNRAAQTLPEDELNACIDAFLRVGDIYFYSGNYIESFNYYLRGLELSDHSPSKHSIAVFHKNIGNIYSVFKDHEQSLIQYEEGLRLCGTDSVVALKILQNMMGTYTELHDVENSRKTHNRVLEYKSISPVSNFMNGYNYALLLHEEKKYDEAIALFKKMADYARRHSLDPKYECSAIEQLSKTYEDVGNRDSTFHYLKKCNEFASSKGLLHMFSLTYRDLADFYDREGDHDKAIRMRSRYLQVHDSIFDDRSFDMLKSQQLAYEMGKTEKKIMGLERLGEHNSEVIRLQRIVIVSVIIVVIAVVLLLVNVYRKNKTLNASYRNLFQLNRQLAESHHATVEKERRLNEALAERDSEIEKLRNNTVPDVTTDDTPSEPSKYKSSKLNEDRQNELAAKISQLMEEEKAYCSPDFCLDSLAEMVESNSRYVSQIINEVFDKNFSNYVNEYRVRLASERLADFEHYGSYTIRAIGESVGFKSHTTFLSVFKKTTGITPSIYLRMAREQKKSDE